MEILWNMLIRFLNMKQFWKGLIEICRMAYSKCEINVNGMSTIFSKYLGQNVHPSSCFYTPGKERECETICT
jgi:hypothetical protein